MFNKLVKLVVCVCVFVNVYVCVCMCVCVRGCCIFQFIWYRLNTHVYYNAYTNVHIGKIHKYLKLHKIGLDIELDRDVQTNFRRFN